MRHDRKLAVGHHRDRGHVLLGGVSDAPQAGQARGTLGVTVQVIAACGASLGSVRHRHDRAAPPAGAPLAVAREAGTSRGLAARAPPPPASRPGTTWTTSRCSTEAAPRPRGLAAGPNFFFRLQSHRAYSCDAITWSMGAIRDPCSFWLGATLARPSLGASDGAPMRCRGDRCRSPPGWPICGREARGKGIDRRTLDAALAGISPIPSVVEADRRQPEGRMTFDEYRRRVVSADRIERGRELLAQHASLLQQVESRYGVPRRGHGGAVGHRIQLRRAPGQLLRVRGAGDPGLRGPARQLLPPRAAQRAGDRASRLRRRRHACRARGPAPWARTSSCRRPISATRSISTATAGATSGIRCPTCSRRWPTISPGRAGTPATSGVAR